MLGNFPQAFSHVALIHTLLSMEKHGLYQNIQNEAEPDPIDPGLLP